MYNGVLGMGNGRAFKVSEPPNYLCKLVQESQMVECICREINKIGIESQLTVHGNGFKLKILRMRKFLQIMSKSPTITTKANSQKEKIIDAKDRGHP